MKQVLEERTIWLQDAPVVCPQEGEVVTGNSKIDPSAMTREWVPVPKSGGDSVFAGTLNGSGALEVRVSKTAGESTLSLSRGVGTAGCSGRG